MCRKEKGVYWNMSDQRLSFLVSFNHHEIIIVLSSDVHDHIIALLSDVAGDQPSWAFVLLPLIHVITVGPPMSNF